jgi:CubicO group peptidase (beta-lactamase class C family)
VLVGPDSVLGAGGDLEHRFALASVTKLLSALTVLVATEEHSIGLADPLGPPGATVAHLLAHASGLGPERGDRVLAEPGTRRIYSNAGFELLGEHLARSCGLTFADYLHEAVLAPLAMEQTSLDGSAARGATSTATDLARFAGELLAPTLVDQSTLAAATSVAFPGLAGVLPGFGQQNPCDWGLGFELRDAKRPHWTSTANSSATFGHFGQGGSFLWVDPPRRLAFVVLSDRLFATWATTAWPLISDAVLAHHLGEDR